MNALPKNDNEFYVVGDMVVDPEEDGGVKLPHIYSTTEQKVGYWVGGTIPVYECVFEFSATTTISNNTWTSVIEWTDDIQVVSARGLANAGGTCFTCISAQYDASASRIKVLNTRGTNVAIDKLILEYYYIPPTP